MIMIFGLILLGRTPIGRLLITRRRYGYPLMVAVVAIVHILFHVIFGEPFDWATMVIRSISVLASIEITRRLMGSGEKKD